MKNKKANWEKGYIDTGDGPMPQDVWTCSNCHNAQWRKSNYCPNCGADMRKLKV